MPTAFIYKDGERILSVSCQEIVSDCCSSLRNSKFNMGKHRRWTYANTPRYHHAPRQCHMPRQMYGQA